jgi:hypothetical protein
MKIIYVAEMNFAKSHNIFKGKFAQWSMADSDRQDQNAGEIFRPVTILGSVTKNYLYRELILFPKN